MSSVLPSPRAFADCRDITNGPVILLASGTSAKNFPIAEFAHVPVIAMNGSISLLLEAGIAPFFYACTDRDFARQQPELFSLAMEKSQRIALWKDQYENLQPPPKGEVFLLRKVRDLSFLQRLLSNEQALVRSRNSFDKRARSLGFSKDLQQGFFDARTVAYVALQIAYHVGFTQVFLVGVDLQQSAGRFYEQEGSDKSPCGLDQHFQGRILPSFELTARQVVGDRFRIYNLSATSRIPDDVIPKITLDRFRAMAELPPQP
ncbi:MULTISPECIES: lipopolysaccharide biosynthesis protein [Pseudomonas]|uniref:lipopolysaccharide biosynthesis protein n=1 Tax=Pseudomonas guariconensis TaxID=1288410 RepID=UPI0020969373|nr:MULTISPECIES: lipopolysaccharide biosynthesis protein [Pseudomonas]MCO7593674.1 lipopolysaccharide biosynthesis protein [Pseudomonas guariconensis]MCU7222998.1 lipopolysaccharide biosynthesis protein [Pseudomonas brassicacearum]